MGRNLGPLNIKDSYEGLVQISGSNQLTDGSGSLISSLDVNAATATSASFATTASYALFASGAADLNAVYSASATDATITFTKGDASTFDTTVNNVANATSASFATTASFALNVTPIDTGSLMVTGSVTDATLTFTKGDGSTFDLTVDNVVNATSASFATTATNAVSASIADSATTALLATTASHAIFAETASFLPADTNLNINSITASNASFTSASIGYLQTITGSAKIIGDAFIILNNNLPTERYAGLVVQDSGSGSPLTTSSLQYDGQTDDWFYEYSTDGGVTTDHGVAMFGPEYSVKGVPTYNTANTILKGDGGHHILDSSITDDGTLVTIDANVSASGYVSASTFIGDGSQLSGISTTPFPYTGDAEITGSLTILGDIQTGDSNNTITKQTGDDNYAIIGGDQNTINHTSVNNFGDNLTIVGGISNTISGNFLNESSILGGQLNTINAQYSNIFGGRQNSITGEYQHTIIGGGNNTISGGGANKFILGGNGNSIGNSAGGSLILGGGSNSCSGASSSIILGGSSNTNNHSRSVILGGQSLSTTKADEVVVNHLSIYGDTFISSSTLGTGSLIDNLGQEAILTGSQVQHIVNLSQAEYDASTPDANTLYVIDGAETLGDTVISGSLTVAAGEVLTLAPVATLPTAPPTGSFAVSGSTPPKPYFYDGTSWNALY